ncbi:MAG: type II toxin-antitoxin system VapC family toxin [Deltaproteobacteria bacterium]|nr:type II toxin-antitoxin system VapC family toxin [Deltaproteobacteria bacterium]
MSFLLDTNVVSEWVKPQPDRNVVSWLAEVDEDRVFISVISFAEIRRGIELMGSGRRRERLAIWLAEELPNRFEQRILSIGQRVADTWGIVMARSQKRGVALSSIDGLIAATAEKHNLTLVTRNTKDFEASGISLLDPWQRRS